MSCQVTWANANVVYAVVIVSIYQFVLLTKMKLLLQLLLFDQV